MKTFSLWTFSTLIVYFLLAFVMMFSRETTLHGVRAFDFKMIIQSQKSFDQSTYSREFTDLTNVLGLSVGKEREKIFFPLAVIEKKSCSDNGIKIDTICNRIPDTQSLSRLLDMSESRRYAGVTVYKTKMGDFFIHKINSEKFIVGEAGVYLSDDKTLLSRIDVMLDFINLDFYNYFLTINGEPGKYGGLSKTWTKSQEIFTIVFVLSYFGYIATMLYLSHIKKLNRSRIQVINNKLENARNKLKKFEKERERINNDFYQLTQQKHDLQQSFYDQNQETEYYIEEYKNLEEKILETEEERDHLARQYKYTDDDYEKLIEERQLQSDRSGIKEIEKELRILRQEQSELRNLWKLQTKWMSRLTIETKYSDTGRVPFTTSIAFIAFEQYIDEYFEQIESSTIQNNTFGITLKDKIDLIGKLDYKLAGNLHKIRIARNKWFHSGIAPQKGLLSLLLNLIKSEKPRI